MSGKQTSRRRVFVRPYPPLAMALGTSFLAWLFGSLVRESFFHQPRDLTLGILFLALFLPCLGIALYSWISILFIRRVGLKLDDKGVIHTRATCFGPRIRKLPWRKVDGIALDEKGKLTFSARDGSLEVATGDLLENPQWILEQARSRLRNSRGEESPTHEPVPEADIELGGITCRYCGAAIIIQPESRGEIACPSCGSVVGNSHRILAAMKRVISLIRDLPEAHRRFHRKTLEQFVLNRIKNGRILFRVGWATAGVWMLFAAVEVLSSLLRDKAEAIHWPFIAAMAGFVILALASSYMLAAFGRRTAAQIAPAFNALAPPRAGGSARCRFCGADLPDSGIIRRCAYCGSDSVVMGEKLAVAERTAREALDLARRSVSQSTESGLRLLNNSYGKLQTFAWFQLFWLNIPILVALDGNTGMLYRITGLVAAMLAGTLLANRLGVKWLNNSLPDPAANQSPA